jgi:hypothetical protein
VAGCAAVADEPRTHAKKAIMMDFIRTSGKSLQMRLIQTNE